MKRLVGLLVVLSGCSYAQLLFPAESHLEPATAGADYVVQGEYVSREPAYGAQVIALGDDDFEAVLYRGGLPGDGWDGTTRVRVPGLRNGSSIAFREGGVSLLWSPAGLAGTLPDGMPVMLAPTERVSPTLGAPPPRGAIAVFDGSGTEHVEGTIDDKGHLEVGATSRAAFRDFDLHVEFRTPFTPGGRGQFRGNSGVYLQDRYEVQVLDSFGLPEMDDDCGGIYQVAAPRVNMSFPPLRWQTYDISFRAARWDAAGEKTENARVTVRHNGVVIHDDVEIPGPTGGGNSEEDTPGPIYLQNHLEAVAYRNVWVLPK